MQIGKIIATEKVPTTVDFFTFWTDKHFIIRPFDVVKVKHLNDSTTYGVVEEISHLTDSSSFLASFISSDFGDLLAQPLTERIGMNYIKARVVGNTKNVFTPVLDGYPVTLADATDVKDALGLNDDKNNTLPCGYIEMYEAPNSITIPVKFNPQFLIGPEGAHLNISGISGLASKTSYAMFLMKAIQEQFMNGQSTESTAFVILNVKGRDLLAIDEVNNDLKTDDKKIYKSLGLTVSPFKNVKYYYPYGEKPGIATTYAKKDDVKSQMDLNKAFIYKYRFEEDRESLGMLFANIDDPLGTMESIVTMIENGDDNFSSVTNWADLKSEVKARCEAGRQGGNKEITVASWRKFYRILNKVLNKSAIYQNQVNEAKKERQLFQAIKSIKKDDVYVVDIAKLDEETQGFVFGDVMRAVYDLKLGQIDDREESDIPSRIVIFIDELNKYASKDVPKGSPILKQLLDITERGRSLGIVLFSAEQFRSDIYDRVKGNCATHAYGRTNAIEVSKPDYQYVPPVYKSMLTRLKQGEYILQNPIFRSLLNIKFPKPIYRQFKNG